MSWKPEVQTTDDGKWTGNGMAFATKEEADRWAVDLSMRWTLVRDVRAVESTEPVNYAIIDNKLEAVNR